MVKKTKVRGKTCYKVRGIGRCFKSRQVAGIKERELKRKRKRK